jgi:hypothetical protein
LAAIPLFFGVLTQSLGPAGQYLRVGWACARADKDALQRAARDERALAFGLGFLAGAYMAAVAGLVVFSKEDIPLGKFILVLALIVAVWVAGVMAQLALCHVMLKKFAGGTGSFLHVLRPLLLSSVVLWFSLVPIFGLLVASAWWVYWITPWVFKEIHGVSFGKAFVALLVSALLIAVFSLMLIPIISNRLIVAEVRNPIAGDVPTVISLRRA